MPDWVLPDVYDAAPCVPELPRGWCWCLADPMLSEGWWVLSLHQTDAGYDVQIYTPGGFVLFLGQFPLAIPVTRTTDIQRQFRCWTVPRDGYYWELMMSEHQPYGLLALQLCPAAPVPPVMAVGAMRLPVAFIAELGACLGLPPVTWPQRAGWWVPPP
jgi:hypothetical protein